MGLPPCAVMPLPDSRAYQLAVVHGRKVMRQRDPDTPWRVAYRRALNALAVTMTTAPADNPYSVVSGTFYSK
jgi:hypothetical protein